MSSVSTLPLSAHNNHNHIINHNGLSNTNILDVNNCSTIPNQQQQLLQNDQLHYRMMLNDNNQQQQQIGNGATKPNDLLLSSNNNNNIYNTDQQNHVQNVLNNQHHQQMMLSANTNNDDSSRCLGVRKHKGEFDEPTFAEVERRRYELEIRGNYHRLSERTGECACILGSRFETRSPEAVLRMVNDWKNMSAEQRLNHKWDAADLPHDIPLAEISKYELLRKEASGGMANFGGTSKRKPLGIRGTRQFLLILYCLWGHPGSQDKMQREGYCPHCFAKIKKPNDQSTLVRVVNHFNMKHRQGHNPRLSPIQGVCTENGDNAQKIPDCRLTLTPPSITATAPPTKTVAAPTTSTTDGTTNSTTTTTTTTTDAGQESTLLPEPRAATTSTASVSRSTAASETTATVSESESACALSALADMAAIEMTAAAVAAATASAGPAVVSGSDNGTLTAATGHNNDDDAQMILAPSAKIAESFSETTCESNSSETNDDCGPAGSPAGHSDGQQQEEQQQEQANHELDQHQIAAATTDGIDGAAIKAESGSNANAADTSVAAAVAAVVDGQQDQYTSDGDQTGNHEEKDSLENEPSVLVKEEERDREKEIDSKQSLKLEFELQEQEAKTADSDQLEQKHQLDHQETATSAAAETTATEIKPPIVV